MLIAFSKFAFFLDRLENKMMLSRLARQCNALGLGLKGISQRAAQRWFSGQSGCAGIVELREYVIKPEFIGEYLGVSSKGGDLRKRLVPLRLFAVPEVGDTLNQVCLVFCIGIVFAVVLSRTGFV